MAANQADILKPSGQCPVADYPKYNCNYGKHGSSHSTFTCHDHAKIHCFLDHKMTTKTVNSLTFNRNFRQDGRLATQHHYPPTLATLKALPKTLQVCSGKYFSGFCQLARLFVHLYSRSIDTCMHVLA